MLTIVAAFADKDATIATLQADLATAQADLAAATGMAKCQTQVVLTL